MATAFVLPGVDIGSAMAMKYEKLARSFGVRDLDWQILDRFTTNGDDGEEIETFVIGTKDSQELVHFDVAAVLKSPDAQSANAAVAAAREGQADGDLTIPLPQNSYLALWKIVDGVGDRFATNDFRFDPVRRIVLQAMVAHDLRSGRPMEVTLPAADWAGLRAIAGSVETTDLRLQELADELIALLDASLLRAGPG